MAEIESINSKANAGLATGIIGTALGGLMALHNGGIFNTGLFANAGNVANAAATVMCGDSAPITRYEARMMQELAQKDTEIALLKSEQNTEIKIADVYERVMTRVNQDQRDQAAWNTQQSVNNATMSAAISANATSISALQNCCSQITKLVVPNTSVCPGWGNVTITPSANGTTTA